MKGLGCWMLCVAAVMVSCVRYDAGAFEGEVLPRMTGYTTGVTNDWLYIELSSGSMLNASKPEADVVEGGQRERTDWDIAFCGCLLRTNGGTSGCGKGAARRPGSAEWVTDTTGLSVTMSQMDWNRQVWSLGLDLAQNPWFEPNRGPATTTTSANPLLCEALVFAGPPAVYTPSGLWYEVRTADGGAVYRLRIVSWNAPDQELGEAGGRISYQVEKIWP